MSAQVGHQQTHEVRQQQTHLHAVLFSQITRPVVIITNIPPTIASIRIRETSPSRHFKKLENYQARENKVVYSKCLCRCSLRCKYRKKCLQPLQYLLLSVGALKNTGNTDGMVPGRSLVVWPIRSKHSSSKCAEHRTSVSLGDQPSVHRTACSHAARRVTSLGNLWRANMFRALFCRSNAHNNQVSPLSLLIRSRSL